MSRRSKGRRWFVNADKLLRNSAPQPSRVTEISRMRFTSFFISLPNDLEFSGEHRGSAATAVIVRCNSWLDSSSKKPSADRNDKESYRQRRQFLPVLTAS